MAFHLSHVGSTELLQIADAVAREKGIARDEVLTAMEQAIQVASRRKYGHEQNVCARINRKTGEIQLFREREVVETVEDPVTQIDLEHAHSIDGEVALGGIISEPLPPIDLGRVAAQSAKQVIMQKVREAERDREYQEFKDRVGEIINGVVERIEHGNIIVKLGRTEALLPRRGLIRNEMLKQNDRIRAYVEDVRQEVKGPQIFLSRTRNEFLIKLFMQEVPEVYDGVIEIKSVAREPGSRAKMAVYTSDGTIDPVGSCVGVRGARVQAVTNELRGEKIDIIHWSSDPATFVVSALAPAEVSKVVIDEKTHRIEAIVAKDQLSLAIGRRGQNVRLASQVTGWNIDVLDEEEESKRRVEEFNQLTQLFIRSLDVEEVLAQLLAAEGFTSVEELSAASIEELAEIEGFDEDLAQALKERAESFVQAQSELFKTLPGMTQAYVEQLHANDIATFARLSQMTVDTLQEIFAEDEVTKEEMQAWIEAAKAHDSDEDL